jgi:hypothetical protein
MFGIETHRYRVLGRSMFHFLRQLLVRLAIGREIKFDLP